MSTNSSHGLMEFLTRHASVLTELRRDLHAHPELSFQEQRTSDLIAANLASWGIPIHRGLGRTGVVGIVRGGDGMRSIGLRADFDALPITEQNSFAHASVYPGRMHACGHDGHTAMLLAAAKYLAVHRSFPGTVYLVFQPAEEQGGGAHEMIKDGLFQRFPMDAVFGIHNWPGLPVGQFAVRSGPVFASSSELSVIIRGKGAHAAMPHFAIDPVLIGCHVVQAFQTIVSRNLRPTDAAVISVTSIRAGEATNAIPSVCELRGTVRTFREDVLDMIEQRMREILRGASEAFGAETNLELRRYYPPTINTANETAFVRQVLTRFVGPENVLEAEPTMGAEDFSFLLRETPGCYFLVGNGDAAHAPTGGGTLHSPHYDFDDRLIPLGGAMWVRLVDTWFAENP